MQVMSGKMVLSKELSNIVVRTKEENNLFETIRLLQDDYGKLK